MLKQSQYIKISVIIEACMWSSYYSWSWWWDWFDCQYHSHIQKKNTGDYYHDEMTADHFEEWFATKLLPNAPRNSVIVMDNASYPSCHSDPVPVQSWTNQMMQDWLQAKGVELGVTLHYWVVKILTLIWDKECIDPMKKWVNGLGFVQVSESDNTYVTCSSTSQSSDRLACLSLSFKSSYSE